MLELVRSYAAERLAERGEAEQLRARHASYFLELAEHRPMSWKATTSSLAGAAGC